MQRSLDLFSMADTAHRDEEFLKEHFDLPEELDRKAQYLAQMMKESRHLVVFTGAGISTSAGISILQRSFTIRYS